jgi:hypothetical protein
MVPTTKLELRATKSPNSDPDQTHTSIYRTNRQVPTPATRVPILCDRYEKINMWLITRLWTNRVMDQMIPNENDSPQEVMFSTGPSVIVFYLCCGASSVQDSSRWVGKRMGPLSHLFKHLQFSTHYRARS